MIAVISPAKKLDFEPCASRPKASRPVLAKETALLLQTARTLKPSDLKRLMKLSDSLATLNYERFQSWQDAPKLGRSAKQAALAFAGDTYVGLGAGAFTDDDLQFAQGHLRILSGLYGLLRPLDLIQPYRLEMGTRLQTVRGKDLYEFWGDRIAKTLLRDSKKAAGPEGPVVVNLASTEYFRAACPEAVGLPVLTCVFKEVRNGEAKVISFCAKRARGMMACFMVRNRLKETAPMKDFAEAGYRFQPNRSSESEWVFHRK